jgi:molybdenum cofactor biosynthesis enzyme MoaA
LDKLITVYPHLSPINDFFKVRYCNVTGNTQKEMIEELFILFENMNSCSQVLFNFVEQIKISHGEEPLLKQDETANN